MYFYSKKFLYPKKFLIQKINERILEVRILKKELWKNWTCALTVYEPGSFPLSQGPHVSLSHQNPFNVGSKMAFLGVHFQKNLQKIHFLLVYVKTENRPVWTLGFRFYRFSVSVFGPKNPVFGFGSVNRSCPRYRSESRMIRVPNQP